MLPVKCHLGTAESQLEGDSSLAAMYSFSARALSTLCSASPTGSAERTKGTGFKRGGEVQGTHPQMLTVHMVSKCFAQVLLICGLLLVETCRPLVHEAPIVIRRGVSMDVFR